MHCLDSPSQTSAVFCKRLCFCSIRIPLCTIHFRYQVLSTSIHQYNLLMVATTAFLKKFSVGKGGVVSWVPKSDGSTSICHQETQSGCHVQNSSATGIHCSHTPLNRSKVEISSNYHMSFYFSCFILYMTTLSASNCSVLNSNSQSKLAGFQIGQIKPDILGRSSVFFADDNCVDVLFGNNLFQDVLILCIFA